MSVRKSLTFLFPIFVVVGAREGWAGDVKWHMSGRDYFENILTAFLQDAYFPKSDVDKKKKRERVQGENYDGFVVSVLKDDCAKEIWVCNEKGCQRAIP